MTGKSLQRERERSNRGEERERERGIRAFVAPFSYVIFRHLFLLSLCIFSTTNPPMRVIINVGFTVIKQRRGRSRVASLCLENFSAPSSFPSLLLSHCFTRTIFSLCLSFRLLHTPSVFFVQSLFPPFLFFSLRKQLCRIDTNRD